MPLQTSVGQLLVNEALPEDMRDHTRVLDKKGVEKLFTELARRYPDKYKDVYNRLQDLGGSFASAKGMSVSLRHLVPSPRRKAILDRLKAENRADRANPELSDEERSRRVVARTAKVYDELRDAMLKEAQETGNPLAVQVTSGGRGNPEQLNSIIGSDLLVQDHRGDFVPAPIYNGYADGLDPAEYFATSYGTRAAQISTKMLVGAAGFAGKQMALATHRQSVTDELPKSYRLPVGLVVEVDDQDSDGSVLARPEGNYPAGTELTPRVLADLKAQGVKKLVVHSPLTSYTEDGGLDRLSAGRRERQGLAEIGDNIGIQAAQAISEPLSQGLLSCLAAGTEVRMADYTVKRIEDIQVGDRVLGADKFGASFPVLVTRTYDQGLQPCSRYWFKRAYERGRDSHLDCTSTHKVLLHQYYSSSTGECHKERIAPIGEMNKTSGVARVRGRPDDSELSCEPRAALLGTLLGDGCFTEAVNGVFLSCADPTQVAWLNETYASHGLEFTQQKYHQGIYYRLKDLSAARGARDPKTGRMLPVARHRILLWLKELGLYGKYAHEKTLPQIVTSWDNASVASLIAGLFVTDGSVFDTPDGVRINLTSTSRVMLCQVRELLALRFGIYTSRVYENTHGERNRSLFSLTITTDKDLLLFAKHIPLFGRKRILLAGLMAAVPGRGHPEWARQAGTEDLGSIPTYDIEVDHPDHLFVLANGLVVSNSKHTAGAGKRRGASGLDAINKLFQAPEHYMEAAPLAPHDGVVRSVTPAPQGGHFVEVGDAKLYVHPGHEITVKPGQRVEQGDDLTSSMPHPADLVRYRGVGAARRDFLKHAYQVMRDNGIKVHRRNLEPLVAGFLNHVQVSDPDGLGDHLVDDVLQVGRAMAQYQPREGLQRLPVKRSIGRYLEEPVLHYTPGTRVTSRVARELEEMGIPDLDTHDQEPPYRPYFERLMTTSSHDPDWRTRMGGFYIGRSLTQAVHRGAVSETGSTSFFPGLAEGKGFGETHESTGKY